VSMSTVPVPLAVSPIVIELKPSVRRAGLSEILCQLAEIE
jgi:hypothetical protein